MSHLHTLYDTPSLQAMALSRKPRRRILLMEHMTVPRMVRCGRITFGWSMCCKRHLPAALT